MRFSRISYYFTLVTLIVMVQTPVLVAKEIGQVAKDSDDGLAKRDTSEEPIVEDDPILLGDTVRPKGAGDILVISMDESEYDIGKYEQVIELSHGELIFLSEHDGIIDCKMEREGSAKVTGSNGCIFGTGSEKEGENEKDGIPVTGTVYQVDVQGKFTRVTVYEGAVSITSTNSKFPVPQVVRAGEWVRYRKDSKISKPKRFTMAIGPGAGSTECIYSDCTLVNDPQVPSRPVVTPSVLVPPPPNPPGQR